MAPTPKVNPTNTSSVAQNANNRLNALVPNMASADSAITVWTTALVSELIAAETPPSNTYGTLPGGTWTCPAGISQVLVELWGGGGGGGGGGLPAQGGGGGGGGGEYAAEPAYPVAPGTQYTYTCGDGGVGGVTGQPGANGVKTVFDLQGIGIPGGMTANGGQGGDIVSMGKGGAGGTGSANTVHYNGGAGGTNATGVGDDVPWDSPLTPNILYWYIMDDDPSVTSTIMDSTFQTVATANNTGPSNANNVVLGNTSPLAPAQAPTTSSIAGQLYQANAFFDWTQPSSSEVPYYRLNNTKLSASAMTVSCWVYPDAGGNYSGNNSQNGTIVATYNVFGTIASPGYAVWIDTANLVHMKVVRPNGSGGWNTSTSISRQLDTAGWNYIVASYDGTNMRLFVYNTTNPSGINTSGAGPSGSGSAVQVNSNSTWIGTSPANSGVNNGFSGYISNLWMATGAITTTTWPNSVYNPSTPSTTGCGGGASGGGGGIGGIGGTGGSGGNGGIAPFAPILSNLTEGQSGNNGGVLDTDGTAPFSDTWSGGGGGAGSLSPGSLPTIKSLTLVAAQSASYAGPDAVDNPSAMYTYSLAPLVTNSTEKQFTNNANLSPDCYQGGQQQLDGNYQGTMSSAVLLPNPTNTSNTLTGSNVTKMTLSMEILSPNSASLILGYTNDTSLGNTFTGSSVTWVTNLPVPAGSQNSVITWDLTSHASFFGALVNGSATCLVLGNGNTPGAASYTNAVTASQFSVAFIGAGGVASGYAQDLTLNVSYTTGSFVTGGQGGPGQIQITYVNPNGTPVASMQPGVTTDSQGNAYAAGFTGPISYWQPNSFPLALENWHNVSAFSNSWTTFAGQPLRYRATADFGVRLNGRANIPAGVANPSTVFVIPAGYRPASTQSIIVLEIGGAPYAATPHYAQIDTSGNVTIYGVMNSANNIVFSSWYPLD